MTLTVGSLFSGIGGIDLGLERAGMRVRWQVEIDPWCQRVLAKHWPDVERFADVRSVGAHNLAPVDVIAGGFPCQDISDVGKRGGITAARSGLWSEFARLIRELRPRYVFVENVSALRVRGLDVVLGDLSASGYDAEWDCIPASAVSAPHRRDRLWVVGYPECSGLEGHAGDGDDRQGRSEPAGSTGPSGLRSRSAILADPDPQRLQERGLHDLGRTEVPDLAWGGGGDEALADASWDGGSEQEAGGAVGQRDRPRRESSRGGSPDRTDWWLVEPNVGRVAHGVPQRVDRLRGLGNAVVPQVVAWIGRRIVEADAQDPSAGEAIA